jgi:hypothetical protein
MEQKDFDIYEILKGVPAGTELYTPMCGKVAFTYLASSKETIGTKDKYGPHYFDKNGRLMEGGEVLLFPSKEMRDWSKFFKKGDVLEFAGDKGVQGTCTFEKFEDETKTRFLGRYVKEQECLYYKRALSFRTADWVKSDDPAGYIRFVEERLGGELNRETLEIKPKKPAFEIGKLYVFNEEDEDGDVTVIGKLIDKDESKDTLTFGKQYEIETEYFIANETFYLNISSHDELREATEKEAELFNKHYSIWEKKEKEAMAQPDFKPFDKVLVRDGKEYDWIPALFVRDRGEGANYRYKVLSLRTGKPSEFSCCIPFEGNENIIFTDHDTENLPF